ncbi:hypothetical protein [Flavobacterium phragmitis]|uniref:Uncharacterized protein n=1 Tax=Flavobacterium phragmitis TaxID=739143 RepID=A0A1I1V7K7_9FLAO|nr:hypothetical protein [Flavobacterium phragmitis]SFD78997.1 hypothetical protein SAMN05216297_11222 [Flavobacterium phragmitis]
MEIKSKFRKLFWIRAGIGFLVFIFTLYLCINSISQYSKLTKNPVFIFSLVFLVLLFFAALDLAKTFKLTIKEEGIEKIFVISRHRQFIPFISIIGFKTQKIRMKGKSGYLTDGYTQTVLQLVNNKNLIISPDSFENYVEIISAIRSKLK